METLARRRQACSSTAVLADDDMIPNILPQIFIVNAHAFSVADGKWLKPTQDTNHVFVQWRARFGLKSFGMGLVVCQFGRTLSPFRKTHACIFCMGACTTHWTDVVARNAAESHLASVLIPPCTTRMLSPQEKHVFHHIKRASRQSQNNLMGEHPGEEIFHRAVVHMWAKTMHQILQKQFWKRAFEIKRIRRRGNMHRETLQTTNKLQS